ncbi:MAG: RsmB/NOP family class I SAM-dependent RNA methyltransferase [Thermosphaera sp.]
MRCCEIDEEIVKELGRAFGSLTASLINALRAPPIRLYLRVNTMKTTAEDVLNELNAQGIRAWRDEHVSEAIYVRLEGPFSLPRDVEKEIVVDEKAAVSVMMGSNLYRPGVLKADSFRTGEFVKVLSKSGFYVGVVETRVSSSTLFKMKEGLVGVNVHSIYKSPPISELPVYKKGWVYPQSLPAMYTTLLLDPHPGDLVVDLNASPGGKTGHVIQYTKGRARVIAFDRNEGKVALLRSNLTRLGLISNVAAIPYDSRYAHLDFGLEGRADKVLVDPPCSNLGVRPKLVFNKTINDVLSNAEYQKQFLRTAYKLLKSGGVVAYSTCTLTLRENEEIVSYAVEELGLENIEADLRDPRVDKVYFKGTVGYRFHPLNNDMPGYFIALLRKP